MSIDVTTSLGELAIEDPRRTQVFASLGLDYCCNGHVSLADAVGVAALDIDEVTQALTLPDEPGASAAGPRDDADLAHDIVDIHHAYMWAEMPRLTDIVETVARVHGQAHPELAEVKSLFATAVSELEPHMTREERVVFPAISRMEKAQSAQGAPALDEPISQLRDEHAAVGELLRRLRELTHDFAVPEDACTSYTLMLEGLEHMERDLHEHIHKENNILFPRALELAQRLVVE